MSNLARYSIENDQSILLQFADGSQRRVGYQELPQYLDSSDIARVKRGWARRQNFFKGTLPKWLMLFALGAGVALVLSAKRAAIRLRSDLQQTQSFNGQARDLMPVQPNSNQPSTNLPEAVKSFVVHFFTPPPVANTDQKSHDKNPHGKDKKVDQKNDKHDDKS